MSDLGPLRDAVSAAMLAGEDPAGAVCRAVVAALPVDGGQFTAMTSDAVRELLCASDETIAKAADLEFSLGEGPCLQAFDAGAPVLIPDLAASTVGWPVFAAAAASLPLGGLFVFPLQVGAITVGVCELYRREPGPLEVEELGLVLFQLQTDEGPCLDCFRTGEAVTVTDLTAAVDRWPRFAPALLGEGYSAVQAVPLRLREQVIGALNLFKADPGELSPEDLQVAQALADVATISILQERAAHRSEVLVEQLQGALNSRVIIEQAKGRLAEHANLAMDEAFDQIRAYARTSNRRLTHLARDLVAGTIKPATVLNERAPTT